MKPTAVAWLLGMFGLLFPFLVYAFFIRLLGFPDGHLTELERAERVLFWIFAGCSWILGFVLVYFSRGTPNEATDRHCKRMMLLYACLFLISLAVDVGFRYTLNHGGGG